MNLPALKPRFEAADYLAWEAEQAEKHEYVAGEVFSMAGASANHVTIAGNMYMALRAHLRGGPCSVYIADMKLRLIDADAYFYPDVFVTCSAADRALPLEKREPTLIVEVLSPATAAYDSGAKFAAYRTLPTLREYVLIDPERRSVDVFRRMPDAHDVWTLHPAPPAGLVALQSVALQVEMEAVFEGVAPIGDSAPE